MVPISWACPACPILPFDRKQSSPDNTFLLLFLLVFHLCLTLNCFDLHENIGEIKEEYYIIQEVYCRKRVLKGLLQGAIIQKDKELDADNYLKRSGWHEFGRSTVGRRVYYQGNIDR